ncbi:MAG: hypothetical protein KIS88_03960 [Anaerolineales bacterium]|nr:hypothetical protein [Anaerolineales bacterium]
MSWQDTVRKELATADAARARGNEGMARVCARRAAGWAIKAHLGEAGVNLDTNSVIEHFRHMLAQDDTQAELRLLLEHLRMPKLRPNLEEDSFFPEDIDLIAEARQVIGMLFPGEGF